MTTIRARIIGTGSCLPSNEVSNDQLANVVDTSDEWIVQRTGIRSRRLAVEGQTTADLALAASHAALRAAGIDGADLDVIVLATTSPDRTFPATAVRIQAALGAHHGAAFDVQAVCSGFVYALGIADNMIRLGQARTALVIGAETFSRLLDWTDRSTCVLFGDGAGAVVLQAVEHRGGSTEPGIVSTHLRSDGRYEELLYADGGPSSTSTVGKVRMRGQAVFKHAVVNLAEIVDVALAATGLCREDIDWLVPHQANQRIIEATARKLGLPLDRVVQTVADHANTSAASIPLALDRAVADGRIQPGHLVLMEAMGAGLTWGAALVRW